MDCSNCGGTGTVISSDPRTGGTFSQMCGFCSGTGRAPVTLASRVARGVLDKESDLLEKVNDTNSLLSQFKTLGMGNSDEAKQAREVIRSVVMELKKIVSRYEIPEEPTENGTVEL